MTLSEIDVIIKTEKEVRTMLTELRQQAILDLLSQRRAVTVIELTELLNSSESTIRRDLTALHEMGRLKKVHGGATAVDDEYSVAVDVSARKDLSREEKKRIAAYGATLVSPGDFVYIDAGTTTDLLVDCLTQKRAVYVTNALSHARKLAQGGCRVILLGGEFKLSTDAAVGTETVHFLKKYHFTKGFFGVNGIHPRGGLSTTEANEAAVKAEALSRCRERYVLADPSKFSQISPVTFGALSDAVILTTTLEEKRYRSYTRVVEVDPL